MAIKTLHITNSYHPSSGGIRTFYNALLAGANRHKRPLRLVVPAAETAIEEVGEFGRIYHVAAPRVPVFDTRYRWMLPHTYALPYKSALRKILAAERPDLIEVCDKFSLIYLAGVLRGRWIEGVSIPVIVGLTCERLDDNVAAYASGSRAARYSSDCYMRRCYAPRFDFHIAASDYIAEEVRRVLPENLRDRLYVRPMGVNFEAFSGPRNGQALRQRLLSQLDSGERTIMLLYAGRLSKEKNLGILPAVLSSLANQKSCDYRLVIAGDGPFGPALRHSLERVAAGRSIFVGHNGAETLRALYHAADIFIHPNPREPFGIGPLEAMAAGLPLVAPRSGGLLTYANSENAWLVENDPASFAQAIQSVHSDTAAQRSKTTKARQTAEEFSWSRRTADYFALYDQLHERYVRERLKEEKAELVAASDRGSPEVSSF